MKVTLFYCLNCVGDVCFKSYYGLCINNPVRLLYGLNIKIIINIRTHVLYILVDSLLQNTLLSLQKYNKIMKPSRHIVRNNYSLIIHNASQNIVRMYSICLINFWVKNTKKRGSFYVVQVIKIFVFFYSLIVRYSNQMPGATKYKYGHSPPNESNIPG